MVCFFNLIGMTFRHFQYLDEDDQQLVCWEMGVAVADRAERGYIYQLFQIDAFYVEVKYNISLNIVESYTAFESTDKLGPYLETILIVWPM